MIRALLLSLALAVPAAPAMAFLEPPASYNRPFPGGTTVRWFPKAEMWDNCNKLAGRQLPRHPAECGKWRWVLNGKMLPVGVYKPGAKRRCFVYINERFKGTPDGDLLFRHGRAHCLGWKHPINTAMIFDLAPSEWFEAIAVYEDDLLDHGGEE